MYGNGVMHVWTLGILRNACMVFQPIIQHWGMEYVYVVVIGCKEVNVSECGSPLDVQNLLHKLDRPATQDT